MSYSFLSTGNCTVDADCVNSDDEFNFQECRLLENGQLPDEEDPSKNGCLCSNYLTEVNENGKCTKPSAVGIFFFAFHVLAMVVFSAVIATSILTFSRLRSTYEKSRHVIVCITFVLLVSATSIPYTIAYMLDIIAAESTFTGIDDETGEQTRSTSIMFTTSDLLSNLFMLLLLLHLAHVWKNVSAKLFVNDTSYFALYFAHTVFATEALLVLVYIILSGFQLFDELLYVQLAVAVIISFIFTFASSRIVTGLDNLIKRNQTQSPRRISKRASNAVSESDGSSNDGLVNAKKNIQNLVFRVRILGSIMIVTYIVSAVYEHENLLISPTPGENVYFWNDYVNCVSWICLIVSCSWFLYQMAGVRNKKTAISKVGVNVDALYVILDNPNYRVKFEEAMRNEHSFESLAFLIEVRKFERNYNALALPIAKSNFLKIYEDFIDPKGRQQVNLPFNILEDLNSERSKYLSAKRFPTADVFSAAAVEIQKLIALDSVNRFLKAHPEIDISNNLNNSRTSNLDKVNNAPRTNSKDFGGGGRGFSNEIPESVDEVEEKTLAKPDSKLSVIGIVDAPNS